MVLRGKCKSNVEIQMAVLCLSGMREQGFV